MEALVHLRSAVDADLVFEGRMIENRVYFYKSLLTGNFCGPYEVITQDEDTAQILVQIKLGMIYLPNYKKVEEGFSCTMHFMKAQPEDLKMLESYDIQKARWIKTLKFNFCYWLLINESLVGPFFIQADTNANDLATQLMEESVFILAHKSTQAFPELNKIPTAS